MRPLLFLSLPEKPGVYFFKNQEGEILYVGKSRNLRERVVSYFRNLNSLGPKTKILVSRIEKIDYTLVESELEALLLEAYLIKTHQPFFNTRAKDDKHPLYIKITLAQAYPRVFTVRQEEAPGAIYFGPFPSSQTVKQVLRFLRSIFPFDTQKTIGKRPCFWSHIGLCHPCPSVIEKLPKKKRKTEKAKYRKNIKRLVAVLSRKTKNVKEDLKKEMEKLGMAEKFEEAARIRDQLVRLEYVTKEYRRVSSFLENQNLVADIQRDETQALEKILTSHFKFNKPLSRLECYDASHTARVNPTVGMATFVGGEPEKSLYRKFRIRGKVKDDLSFLEEALRRRFAHPEWGLGDLLVIDGGKQQTKRALDVLRELKIKIPVVGLVKPFDNLVIPHHEGFLMIKIKDQAALSLLQRLRDEAHRFARAYHLRLRTVI